MKSVKLLTSFITLGLSFSSYAVTNISDDLDRNTTPAIFEERENEFINSKDAVDENAVPGPLEERQKEEEMESDAIQTDDPRKAYDPIDSELDE